MENILLAQELVRNYHKADGKPRCAIKVDIKKAFDSARWDFVLSILEVIGFPIIFIQWIKECITTPIFFVKINGVSEGYFAAKRGVRQGDPLPPYLFVLNMEVLFQMLNKARHFAYHPHCLKVKLTYLCFADDLIIFTEPMSSSLLGVKSILDKFYSLFGLEVSYPKSECFSSGIPGERN